MGKELKRFLWGLLGIVLLFLSIQNIEAVTAGVNALLTLFRPLLYGCAIAFVLNLILRQLERFLTFGPFRNKVFRRVVSTFLALLILCAVLAGVVAGVVPELRASGELLMEKLPGAVNTVIDFLVNRLGLPAAWFTRLQVEDLTGLVDSVLQSGLIQQVLQSGGSIVGGAVTTVVDLLVGLCFSFYVLMQKESLGANLKRIAAAYLKPRTCERLLYVTSKMNEIYTSFISGQCLDAMILGLMVTVVLAVFGIEYSLLIGILVAVTALVPVVGSFIGGLLGVFLLLMVSFKKAVIFLVALLVLQQVDNRLIYPHVVGNAVGLPAIWIFAAIVLGANLGGVFGMIFAIPLFALVYTLLSENLRQREQQKKAQETET